MTETGGRRCTELVARTPQVILTTRPGDYTHLQRCNRPTVRMGKCRRHLKQPNTGLDAQWRRFLRRTR